MASFLCGVDGTSFDLSFLKNRIDYVIDDKWNDYSLIRKLLFQVYWGFNLGKPFRRVCYHINKLNDSDTAKDIVFIGNIFRREELIPKLRKHGFIMDKNCFEAFDLSPAYCELKRMSVTSDEIKSKDFEDDYLKLSIMSKYIPDDVESICDIGCGECKLVYLLSNKIKYIGIDYIRKGENIINVDLNVELLPKVKADCFFGCGILEFIDDVHSLLAQVTSLMPQYILFSYSPREYSRLSTLRSKVYHNCLYSSQIVSDICSKGYSMTGFWRYESRQAIYRFSKNRS